MSKKRHSSEVNQLDSARKTQANQNQPIYYQQGIFELSNKWEAWVLVEAEESEESDFLDEEEIMDDDDYEFVEEGTLDECLFALTNLISYEVSNKYLKDNLGSEEWSRKQQERREEIKRECYLHGRAKGKGWEIESSLGRASLKFMIESGHFQPIK